MNSAAWLSYFERNQRAPASLPERLSGLAGPERDALVHSLQRFQVGEASGGRIADEVMSNDDPALDLPARLAIRLYVREEHRHARELLGLIRALGAEPLGEHWSNRLFRRCRRLLGFRTKLLSMAAAEVVGVVFYGIVRDAFACPALRAVMAGIARDEARHLDFQAAWFRRAHGYAPRGFRAAYAFLLQFAFMLILSAAIATVLLDHRRVLGLAGVTARAFVAACLRELATRRTRTGLTSHPEQRTRLEST